jgi:tetratricopeptide (TPR) repeat protein
VRKLWVAAIAAIFSVSWARADTYLVLPFFNLSKDSNLDWIGESLADTMQEAFASEGLMTLERDDRVEVYRRLSIRQFSLLTKASVLKVGQELDAEHVIYGEFNVKPAPDASKSRGSLELSAYVLDLKRMREGPRFRENGALEDLAALQDHLAWQTLAAIKGNAAPTEAEFRQRHPAVRLDAIENYTRGLLSANPNDKHRFLTQAARLEAHYSQPCFQLGRLLWKKKEYASAAEWFSRVDASSAHYHEATFFLGLCRYYTGDFAGAQAAFETVVRAVPLSEVYNDLGAAQSRLNGAGALENFRKAADGDPNDSDYQFNIAYALWKKGDYRAAADGFRALAARDPNDEQAGFLLGRSEKQLGSHPGDPRTEGLERLKSNFEESAYWQLKAVLQPAKK